MPIEADTYLGSPEKLMFLVREFRAELSPEAIHTKANPLLITKLEVPEMAKFDFPKLRLAEVEGGQDLSEEKITARMIDLAKHSISRRRAEDDAVAQAEFADSDDEEAEKRRVHGPSMMILSCNLLEVVRLRGQLSKLIYECDIL
jgi:hypothetical protein